MIFFANLVTLYQPEVTATDSETVAIVSICYKA